MQYDVTYGGQHIAPRARGYIFVVSHMRSFSSLLCHILGSHREIAGYAEMHQSYDGRSDLLQLARKVQDAAEMPIEGRYVLDKMLHGDQYIAPAVLGRPDVKVLFLVRNADDTLKSILNLTHSFGAAYVNPDDARHYYVTRLLELERYSARLGRNAVYVDAESLLDDTQAVLDGLSQWLNLSEPLSASYRTFRFTGTKGYGDPSEHIMAGKVIADAGERHHGYVHVAVPETMLQEAREAYRACRDALMSRHQVLPFRSDRASAPAAGTG
jgi:hypothetical protein